MGCVYLIRNEMTGLVYVGCTSKDADLRWQAHRGLLNHGKHPNKRLQNDWNQFGADAFVFIEAEQIEGDYCALRIAEQRWFDMHKEVAYNAIQPTGIWVKGIVRTRGNRRK